MAETELVARRVSFKSVLFPLRQGKRFCLFSSRKRYIKYQKLNNSAAPKVEKKKVRNDIGEYKRSVRSLDIFVKS